MKIKRIEFMEEITDVQNRMIILTSLSRIKIWFGLQ